MSMRKLIAGTPRDVELDQNRRARLRRALLDISDIAWMIHYVSGVEWKCDQILNGFDSWIGDRDLTDAIAREMR